MNKTVVKGLRRVKLGLVAKPGCKVYVAGTFNDWDPKGNRMRFSKADGKYGTTLKLAPGIHEYKFIVDGEWLVDPVCEKWVSNRFDTLNSVLNIE